MKRKQHKAAEEVRKAYSSRIEELKGYAVEDDIKVNPASERDFWHFIESSSFVKRASLVLCNNGDLKAIWKDAQIGHVGIQFLGNGQGDCMIFIGRGDFKFASRVAGWDSTADVIRLISAFGLSSLVGV